jgi:hypothetical protein
VRFELALIAAWAVVSGQRQSNVGKRRRGKITLLIDFDIMRVGFVGSRHRAAHRLDGKIGNGSQFQTDRS